MRKKIFLLLLIAIISVDSWAQGKHHRHHSHSTHNLPAWAASHNYKGMSHVYFPDYYSFYDPQRGGYVFWDNGKWAFTPALPPYMSNTDMSKTRIQILKGLSLDLHPETNYPHYMKLYPPIPGNEKVPVPTPGPSLGQ